MSFELNRATICQIGREFDSGQFQSFGRPIGNMTVYFGVLNDVRIMKYDKIQKRVIKPPYTSPCESRIYPYLTYG